MDYFENCEQKVYPVRTNFSFARNGSLIIINGEEIIERDSKDIISVRTLLHTSDFMIAELVLLPVVMRGLRIKN